MELIIRHLLSNLLLIGIFLFPAILLVGGVLLLAPSIKKNKISSRLLIIPLSLLFVFILIYFLLVILESSGFIRFIFTFAVLIATALSVIAGTALFLNDKKKSKRNVVSVFIISALCTAASGVAGRLASEIPLTQCERHHFTARDMMVRSLESYYKDTKVFPDNLQQLIPIYISEGSIKTCYSLQFWEDNLSLIDFEGFYYKKCPQGTTWLIIPGVGTGAYHVYDLHEKSWFIYNGEPIGEFGRVVNCQAGE